MNLAAELAARGHSVFLFNQRAHLIDRDLVQRLVPTSVRVLSMADNPLRNFFAHKINALQQRLTGKANYFDRQQQQYLKRCLRQHGIEVVSSHATYSDGMCAPVMQQVPVPFIITEHGEYTIFLLEGHYGFESILQQATSLITVSNYCQEKLRNVFTDLPPLRTIYNGVVTNQTYQKAEMRKALGIGELDFVFGMAARGVALKGWEQAIEAFLQTRAAMERPSHFVLVGGSPYMDELRGRFGKEAGLHFTGRVPNPDFYMAGSDVGLLPSYFPSEALPLSVIEYMTYGLPTIATGIGGIPELIARPQQEAGLLVTIDTQTGMPSVGELATAMQRYIQDQPLYISHAVQARQLSASFTMKACADQYEEVFQVALAQSR
ncbi:glycosyltransferase family 4 protein [Hymenobacter defluvii]|uniref:Glycosyltransferase family 4 protein n=2 Tax=Hymenobacter defluvii TaxID=2054411 RepID=A0ABS3TFN6_9BACT|nr:glycosyltransferase family 4 protein [Hymenobacter defluvii]